MKQKILEEIIKIKSCKNPDSWYKNNIGKVFKVQYYTENYFTVEDNNRLLIKTSDCEILIKGEIPYNLINLTED